MSAIAAARTRAVSVPAWVWLAAIVVASAAVRIVLARRMVAPWIMVDELIYSELAKSFAAHGRFLVRGVPSNGYGFVYPVLIAPAFRLFAGVPRAYAAAKDVNSVAMSLTAVPTYLLARRLLSPALSLVAAVLAVLVPSMLYTGTLMTENAFYPLFVLACLALLAMLERPTALRQVAVLAVSMLCFATRAQAVVLFGAAVLAPPLHGWIERDLRVRLRRYAVLYGAVAAGVLLAVAASLARGRSPLGLLGAYRAAAGPGYSVGSVLKWILWHVAELDLYVGVVAFAALLALWLAPRAATPAARAFAAMSLPVAVLLVVEVAVFASRQSGRIEERNDFYLAPLFLVALVAGVDARVIPRRRRAVAAAALAAGVLPATIPLGHLINTQIVSDTLALQPWWWLQDQGVHFGAERVVAFAVALAAGAAFAAVPPRLAGALVMLTAGYLVLVGAVAENGRHGAVRASQGALFAGIRAPHPDWIDRRVGTATDVAAVWHWNAGETHPLWENEFFNRSVGDVYTVNGPDPSDGGLPETPVHERSDGVLVRADGTVPRARYALSYADLAGAVVARDPIGLALYRVDGPLVFVTRVSGLYANDTWGGRVVTYHRFRCAGGFLTVRVGTDANLFDVDQILTARENGRTVASLRIAPTAQPTLRVRLVPRHGVCTVRFLAARTRVPARVQPGNADMRALAVHYYAFSYAAR
ncbi:MAG TPA: glycosyltransferase family 39 protein [Gaiellaceae bacterium]|nr:glycosyltransferase family 39 protein [Gaiellaceae bacterium]